MTAEVLSLETNTGRRVLQEGDAVRRRVVVPVLEGFGEHSRITSAPSWRDGKFVRYVGTSLVIEYGDGTLEKLASRADLVE